MHFRKPGKIRLAVSVFVLTIFCSAISVSPAFAASCTNATFNGIYGYFSSGYDGSEAVSEIGQMTSNGSGSVTGLFTRSLNGTIASFTFTGTYSLAKSCTGTITYTSSGSTFHFAITYAASDKNFQLVRTDAGVINRGTAIPLGTATCGLSGKSLTLANNVYGEIVGTGAVAYVGPLTFNGKGSITGTETLSIAGDIATNVAVTGTYTQASSCVGTMQLNPTGYSTQNYATFALDGNKQLLLIETDSGTIIGGELQ